MRYVDNVKQVSDGQKRRPPELSRRESDFMGTFDTRNEAQVAAAAGRPKQHVLRTSVSDSQ